MSGTTMDAVIDWGLDHQAMLAVISVILWIIGVVISGTVHDEERSISSARFWLLSIFLGWFTPMWIGLAIFIVGLGFKILVLDGIASLWLEAELPTPGDVISKIKIKTKRIETGNGQLSITAPKGGELSEVEK